MAENLTVFHIQKFNIGAIAMSIFLQAKHKQVEKDKMIKSSHLQNNTNGIFSLSKYFRSYRNGIAGSGRNIQDCILCTNIGFDEADLVKNGFEFQRL